MDKALIATLTVHGASSMTERQRKELAMWLVSQGMSIIKDGEQYAKTFTARYETVPNRSHK